MVTNNAGLGIIKRYEDLRLKAYRCPAGVWTIGYGHTRTAKPGMVITEAQAEDLLRDDVRDAEKAVERLVKVPLTENQFSALVSFVFNVGPGGLGRSTLLAKLNGGGYAAAAQQFAVWINAGGKPLNGLLRRRKDERALFETVDA